MAYKPSEARPLSVPELGREALRSFNASRDKKERKQLKAMLKQVAPELAKLAGRITVPKLVAPEKRRHSKKAVARGEAAAKIIEHLKNGTWKSKNAKGPDYERMIEEQENQRVDALRGHTRASTSAQDATYSRPVAKPAPPVYAPSAPCSIPAAVEVLPGALTAMQAMRCGLPVTPDRTKYRDGVWYRCLPE